MQTLQKKKTCFREPVHNHPAARPEPYYFLQCFCVPKKKPNQKKTHTHPATTTKILGNLRWQRSSHSVWIAFCHAPASCVFLRERCYGSHHTLFAAAAAAALFPCSLMATTSQMLFLLFLVFWVQISTCLGDFVVVDEARF